MIDFTEIEFHKDDLEELMKLEIDFAFQPIFRASDMSIGAYEALMRPKGQSPLELIEAYQKLNKLFVIELATCFGATLAFKKRGYTNTLCINSFPSEFMNEGQSRLYGRYFPELVGKVIVEIVEYTKLDRDKWISKKKDIDRHSTRIALDDFSTGQNNMEALEYFQPQYAKLDRSLICNIHNDSDKQEKVSSLIREFHSRGVKVVAEGIETKEELDYLKAYTKVDYFQGYYLGMPT